MNSHRRLDSDQIAEAVRLGHRSYLIRVLVAISGCAVVSAALLAGSLAVRSAVSTGTSPGPDTASFNIPASDGTAIATDVTATGTPVSTATDPPPMTPSTETVTATTGTPASTATVTTWKTPSTETVTTSIPARTETVVLTKEVDKIGTVTVTELSTTTEIVTTVVKGATVTVFGPG